MENKDNLGMNKEMGKEQEVTDLIKEDSKRLSALKNSVTATVTAFLGIVSTDAGGHPKLKADAELFNPQTKTEVYYASSENTFPENTIMYAEGNGGKETPAMDSIEYKKEREKLIREIEELKKKRLEDDAKYEEYMEQVDILGGPARVLARMEKEGKTITAQDASWAKGCMKMINDEQRLPDLQDLVVSTKKVLQFIIDNQGTDLAVSTK